MQHESEQDTWKRMAGEAAVDYIENGMVIGIGTGSTAAYMMTALARRLHEGLTIIDSTWRSMVLMRLMVNCA